MNPSGRDQFIGLLKDAVRNGSLVKLTLGKPSGADPTLENLFVRPVTLRSGPKMAFVWRHKTRDITKNHEAEEALRLLEPLIGADFLDAHLFTTSQSAQLETGSGIPKLRLKALAKTPAAESGNDRKKRLSLASDLGWLRALGVTDERGTPLASMTDKFRQIQKFGEILGRLLKEAPMPEGRRLQVYDMGCGKGYLTFATSELLGDRAEVHGIEARPDLVQFCNGVAAELGLGSRLGFTVGSIAETVAEPMDVLIALHACDTATDDALAKAVLANASLIVVAPCCQKEVRPQIVAPAVLSPALRHGIFVERQAEFVTDALRAQLLDWSGYRTQVFEFISTEHTAKNTMITAVKAHPKGNPATAAAIRAFAAFYGVGSQALARALGFVLK